MDIKKNEKGLNVRMKEGIDSSFFINEDEKERIYLFQGFSKEEEREARVELWDLTEVLKHDEIKKKEDIKELIKSGKAMKLKTLHSNYLLNYVQVDLDSYTGEYSSVKIQYSELKDCWNIISICSSYNLLILKGILSEDDSQDFNQGVIIKGKKGDSIVFDSVYLD